MVSGAHQTDSRLSDGADDLETPTGCGGGAIAEDAAGDLMLSQHGG